MSAGSYAIGGGLDAKTYGITPERRIIASKPSPNTVVRSGEKFRAGESGPAIGG